MPNFYGAHGYDPLLPNMSAIFFAAGPDIRHGRLTSVRNKALEIVTASLKDRLWRDDGHLSRRGDEVYAHDASAVRILQQVPAGVAGVDAVVDGLITVGGELAEIALDEAIAAAGDAREIQPGSDEITKARADVTRNNALRALERYARAWEGSQRAVNNVRK